MNNKNITKTRWTQNNDINVWNLSSIIRFQMVWVNQWNWYDSKIIKNYIVFFCSSFKSECLFFDGNYSWGVRIIKYSHGIVALGSLNWMIARLVRLQNLPYAEDSQQIFIYQTQFHQEFLPNSAPDSIPLTSNCILDPQQASSSDNN